MLVALGGLSSSWQFERHPCGGVEFENSLNHPSRDSFPGSHQVIACGLRKNQVILRPIDQPADLMEHAWLWSWGVCPVNPRRRIYGACVVPNDYH